MSLKKNGLIVFLAMILISPAGFSQTNISRTGGDSHFGTIAVNQQGAVMVVWLEGAVGNESGILYYNLYQNGQWQGTRNTKLTWADAWSPQLDIDDDGNFHLAWADGVSRFGREIFYSMFNVSTGKWSSREMIWDSPENSAWERISVDGNKVYISWFHENVDPYQGSDIVMIYKTIGGTWPGAYERITWTANNESTHPGLKVKDGRAYHSYMEGSPLGIPWTLGVKEAPVGSNWNNVSRVVLDKNGYYSEIDVDDNDDAHVIFSNRTGNFFYRGQKDGSWMGTQVLSNGYSPLQFGDIDYNNNIIIAVWVQEQEIGRSVFYSKQSPGRNWGEVVKLFQGSEAFAPKVWIDNVGYAHFCWHDRGDIWYERVTAPPSDPFLQLSPQSFSFVIEGANPDPVILTVKNIGQSSLSYTVDVDQDWISVLPTSGNLKKDEEDEIQLTIDARNLEEGTHTGIIEFISPEAINSPQQVTVTLEVLAPPIYPPLNFSGQVLENKALFYRETMHKLTWKSNPLNRDIETYRIYEVNGVNYILLAELSCTTFEYTRRNIVKGKNYTYELWAVDDKGRTGNDPATLTLGTNVTPERNIEDSRIRIIK